MAVLAGMAWGQEEKVVLVPVEREKPVPLFFSAETETEIRAGMERVETVIGAKLRVHQGRPERMSLGLTGSGEVVAVEGVERWTVRREADGRRFLDLRPELPEDPKAETAREFEVRITARHEVGAREFDVLLPAPGEAVGFASVVRLAGDEATAPRVVAVEGLQVVEEDRFVGSGAGRLGVRVELRSSAPRPVEFGRAEIEGRVAEDGGSVAFTLRGELVVSVAGEAVELLEGAALSGEASGEGWFVRLKRKGESYGYELVGEREGSFPIALEFEAPVRREGDWRGVDFRFSPGVVVPVRMGGLGEGVSFAKGRAVAPEWRGGEWVGYLPAAGRASFAWRGAREEGEGALFFTSSELAETRVGSGLARRHSRVDFRVLQGRLESILLDVAGEGEILSVLGPQVLAWSVREEDEGRVLEVRLSRPMESEGRIEVEARTAVGAFPARLGALRFSPRGALRHSGWVRLVSDGAVRLEVVDAEGMMQLAPGQWPGEAEEGRQAFVYRFPSADHDYGVAADQVLPEVGVMEVTIHELAESDRRILADLELDGREAPLREWPVLVPEAFAVAEVSGAEVGDFSVAAGVSGGLRELKVLFHRAVAGRQLVSLRLERNVAAAEGDWELPVLRHPGAKSARGFVGVVAGAGFRVTPGETAGLAEVPPDYFPKKRAGLQQAFRVREAEWSATMRIEALGRSVQADVFHLYSLKEGAVWGSVLVNYFVVGAPANEWRLRVPESLGNVEVTGQNVGRDWRREGETLIVPLARPVLGAATLLVTFERGISARGGEVSPGEVRPLEVQSERGYVLVASPLQVKYDKPRSDGPVLEIDESELPAEYRLLSAAPAIGAWQYTGAGMSISLDVEWFEAGESLGQFVDFAELSSRVSGDGDVVTDARFFVKSRGLPVLRVRLPEGASLWESEVEGQQVNARKDGAETLVPLPPKADPNEPVEVLLRYGVGSTGKRAARLVAPALAAPLVVGEWTVRGDEGRQLVPRGGNARVTGPVMTENGFEWISSRARVPAGLVLLAAVLGLVVYRGGRLRFAGVLLVLLAAVGCFALAKRAVEERRENVAVIDLTAPAVTPEREVSAEFRNVAPWRAMVSGWGIAAVVGGVMLAGYGWLGGGKAWRVSAGLGLAALGILAQRMGAVGFFGVLGAALLLGRCVPWLVELAREWRRPAPVVAGLAVLLCGMSWVRGEGLESMAQRWEVRDGRVWGEMEVTGRGAVDERYLLLRAPAVLTEFEGEGWRVVKAPLDEEEAYFLVALAEGRKSGRARFEMPLAEPQAGWRLPSGPAAVQRLSLRWDEAGWEFFSPQAAGVKALAGLREGESGAELVLGAAESIELGARPRQRDAAREETRFFVEVADLYVAGPGVVNGRHAVSVRPAQGVVGELTLVMPEGFTVGEVGEGPVGSWRFNPESRELRVSVEPAQTQAFRFVVGSQRGTAALPAEVGLAPVRVEGAAGTVGLLGIACGEEAQPEGVAAEGMSVVNLEDFGGDLLPRDGQGEPLATLHRAFRHGGGEASVGLTVAPVAPEVRVETRQVLSLGEDRTVLAVDVTAGITRSGIFRLSVGIPEGFEVEGVSGAALGHWTEGREDEGRVLHLHLQGRTLGEQRFSLTLAGPAADGEWSAPRVTVREASRQTGTLTVAPERGLQVRALSRTNASQLDPKEAGMPQPGVLAFRLLQADWSLSLAVGRLEPWVTAQVLHEVTAREGQTLGKIRVMYRVENAAVKATRVRLAGLDEAAAATLRASGPVVGDFVPVGEGVWEIRFQRGVAGETTVDIEFQRQGEEARVEVTPLESEDLRQVSYFVAVRTAGRLEAGEIEAPRGWQRADWSVVPEALRTGGEAGPPAALFRVAEAEGPLAVGLKRHGLADSLKLRVTRGSLTSLVSPDGAAVTAVDLDVQATAKGSMRLSLPEGASLFTVLVNGDGVPLVKEGGAWRFYVDPAPEGDRPAGVRFVYGTPPGRGMALEGPLVDVPLENLSWKVLLPPGWRLAGYSGDFDLKRWSAAGGIEDYRSFVARQRAAGKEEAVALLDQANAWLQSGEQDRAGQALSKVARNSFLDEASNEDARVQLRNLKTQQAALALNTRRQRMYFDNRAEAPESNDQLERAARENPLLRGDLNYDPREFDSLFLGNSADENAAMRAIANRMVSQQLAADPSPPALDVTLAGRGMGVDFVRSVQIDASRPMRLELEIEREKKGGWFYGGLIALLGAVVVGRKRRE